MINSIAS